MSINLAVFQLKWRWKASKENGKGRGGLSHSRAEGSLISFSSVSSLLVHGWDEVLDSEGLDHILKNLIVTDLDVGYLDL